MFREIIFHIQSKKYGYIALAFYFTVSLFVLRDLLFFPGTIGLQNDWTIHPYSDQNLQRAFRMRFIWDPDTNSGWQFTTLSDWAVWMILSPIAYFGFDGSTFSKVYSIFLFTAIGFFMFKLVSSYGLKFMLAIIAGLFYILSPYVFAHYVAGHVNEILGYAMLPLILLFLKEAIEEEGRVKKTITLGIVYSLFVNASFVFTFGLPIMLYCTIDFLSKKEMKKVLVYLKIFSIIGLLYILLNSFWIIPLIATIFESNQTVLLSPQSVSYQPNLYSVILQSNPLYEVMRLVGTMSVPGEFFYPLVKDKSHWIFTSFLIPIIAFASILLYGRNRNVLFLSLLGIISIILSVGAKPPLDLYVIIYKTLPYLPPDPQRLMVLTGFSYAALISYTAEGLFSKWTRLPTKHNFYLNISAFIVIILILLSYSFPFLLTNFSGKLNTYALGEEYSELHDFLRNDPLDYRVIFLPVGNPIKYPKSHWTTTDPIAFYSGKPTFFSWLAFEDNNFYLKFLAVNFYLNKTSYFGKLLSLGNIKYAISNNIEAIGWQDLRITGKMASDLLSNQIGITKIKSGANLEVFYNNYSISHIYPAKEVTLISGGRSGLISMSYTDLPFNETAFLFANQILPQDYDPLEKIVDSVTIIDGQFTDLVMASIPKRYVYEPGNYVASASSLDGPMAEWVNLEAWSTNTRSRIFNYLVDPVENSALTNAQASMNIPFEIDKEGTYQIWIKSLYGPDGSRIRVTIDGIEVGNFLTKSDAGSFRWKSLSGAFLRVGPHKIEIESAERGEEVISKIIIAPAEVVHQTHSDMIKFLKTKNIVLIYELERQKLVDELTEGKVSKEFGSMASNGEVLSLNTSSSFSIKLPLFIPKNDTYEVYLRTKGTQQSNLKVVLDEKEYLLPLSNDFKWHKIGEYSLENGNYSIFINGYGEVHLDQLLIKSVLPISEPSPKISYRKINPTKYIVNIESTRPFFLIFSESYSPFWYATGSDIRFSSYKTNLFTSGFYINKTGKFEISMEFYLQRYWDAGLIITIVTLALLILFYVLKLNISQINRGKNS